MRYLRETVTAVAAGALGALPLVSCSDETSNTGPELIVQVSGDQPAKELGIIVVAQTRGGATLGIRTRGCEHTLPGIASTTTVSCVPVKSSTNLVYFSALTEEGECVVHAELYAEAERTSDVGGDAGDAGDGDDAAEIPPESVVCPGRGTKLLEREVPISGSRVTALPDASQDSATPADASAGVADAGVEGDADDEPLDASAEGG